MMASPSAGGRPPQHTNISFQSQTLFSSNLQVTAHNGSLEIFQDFQEY